MDEESVERGTELEQNVTAAESTQGADLEERTTSLIDLPSVTSNAELTFEEALRLAGRRGARLIMLMGETGTGKTTIVVELWTHMVGLDGIDGYRFAGSRTAMPLERRAFLSRMAAGRAVPDTQRTHIDHDEGLLHIRLARPDGMRVELLFADYAGERFTHIKDGVPLIEELPWAPRVDRVAVLVDGLALGSGALRERATNSAMRQVLALRESYAFSATASLAIVITKMDQVDGAALDTSRNRLENLLDEARSIDQGVRSIQIAARPADGARPRGLDDLLEWLCADDIRASPESIVVPTPSRAVARLRLE